jgi:uncharacterized protein (TIGR00299 family) protein
MRVACLDASSGVSGDLFLGALVDAGVHLEDLQAIVDTLEIDGLRLRAIRTTRSGVEATKVDVEYPPQDDHRHLGEIAARIEESAMPEDVKRGALAVFHRLAEVEAAVHGVGVQEVHFHEVGAADAMADIVGSVAGLRQLGVETLLVGSINVGSGTVRCAHGLLPVPAPATAGLLDGWRCHVAGPARELTTPTGAALVTTLGHQVDELPELRAVASGCGAGGSDPPDWPNVLRLSVGVAPETLYNGHRLTS